ncbi:uncharacterized protein LOC133888585 [Phragmites australis]|uniref:uncharacterized protein LOC133888585 n=1 Tax=Phragmites australis TaxID=29695 RepID=UPI002D7687E0|nr:uncharacterized protein LOC133888585 [Phragmites australis]
MVAIMHVGTVSPSAVLTVAAFALLMVNSCVATHRALGRGDDSAALFVAAATVLLAALLATVRAHDDEAVRRRRGPLKALAWALSAALTGMFAHRVGALAPAPPVAALVWSMAAATVAGGFYCVFVHGEGYAVYRRADAVGALDVRQEAQVGDIRQELHEGLKIVNVD